MNRIRFDAETVEVLKKAAVLALNYKFEAVGTLEYMCVLMKTKGFFNTLLKSKGVTDEDIMWILDEALDNKNDDLLEAACESQEVFEEFKEEFKKYTVIELEDGTNIDITHEMYSVIEMAENISRSEDGMDTTTNLHIVTAIVRLIPETFGELFKLFGIDADDTIKDLTASTNTIVFPVDIKNCLNVITFGISKNEECAISGRDEELNEIIKTLLKRTKRNVVLVGEAGVGKTALVEKLAYLLRNDKCPEKLKNLHIVELCVNNMIAGTMYRGQAEEKFQELLNFIEWNKNIILFIDEVHTILGAGSASESSLDLANALKPILARENVRIIGATTCEEYEKYFTRDKALKRRFEKIVVEEPSFDEIPMMIAKKVKLLEDYHGVKISRKMVEYAITMSACFFFTGVKNPDRTLDAIDKAMADAELHGEKEVKLKNVKAAFGVRMKIFNQMSIKYKTAVAYHEAGHFIVSKFSKEYSKAVHTRAVSILPAEDYMGINVSETIDYVDSSSRMCCVERIAMLLAGRVAEKKYTEIESAGASSDLNKATELAYRIVTQYGMGTENSFKNRIYNKEVSYGKGQEKLDDEINKIMAEAYRYAEVIINWHEKELKMIVARLLKDGIVSEATLSKICKATDGKIGNFME